MTAFSTARHIPALILFPITLLLLGGCSPDLASTGFTSLESGWQGVAGPEGMNWKDAQNLDFQPLESLRGLEKKMLSGQTVLWLKKSITWTPPPGTDLAGLYLGRISMADQVWFNGHALGGKGRAGTDFWSAWNEGRYFTLPAGLWKSQGENLLLIRIFGVGEAGISGPLVIGTPESVEATAQADVFWNNTINALVSAVLFIMGLYHLLMWSRRPVDRENLYYALTALAFSLYLTNFYIYGTPLFSLVSSIPGLSYQTFQRFIFVSLYATVYAFSRFLLTFQTMEENPWVTWIRRAAALVSVAVLFLPLEYSLYRNVAVPITQGTLLLFLLYLPWLVIRGILNRNKESPILLIGVTPLLAASLFDLVFHQFLNRDELPFLSGFGISAVFFAMLFILAYRFVSYRNNLEDLNVHLEDKVRDRTEELQKTVTDLEAARAVAAKDMAMAVNVQNHVLTAEPPLDSQWEVAFEFRPMSGVSGDFYDFFMRDGKLEGAAVFDVSGHGIDPYCQ